MQNKFLSGLFRLDEGVVCVAHHSPTFLHTAVMTSCFIKVGNQRALHFQNPDNSPE